MLCPPAQEFVTGNNLFFDKMGGKKKTQQPVKCRQSRWKLHTKWTTRIDRATQSRTRAKMEGTDGSTMQTDDACPPSAEQSNTRTTSEVEETPKWQTLLREDTPAEDLAPIARNTDKGKGKYIPPNLEDDHDALLSPQRYKRPQML